ncbi:putative DD41D transposase [Trichonephila inaurata madagascariensis]|uniref:Putative DD41D transposase n=1 Tax=Trichonephila inaurata madagascariensis TaxID=2747483 RepID=A0A8X6XVX5_9ARAC|nr:putative DD41D transposase [Trichonephila inaurata madagascariensis]
MVKYTSEQRLQILKIYYRNSESVAATLRTLKLRVGRSVENIAAVETSIANDPNQSIPRRSQELGIAKTTLWRILRKDLTLHPYKIRLTQELKPMDHSKRRYVKSLVYANKPTTLEELKANIEREIAAVSAEMCGRVMENWVQRIDRCKRARCGHMSEVEFHS